ncbi:DUF2281 domain-containing protein [Methylobacter sp.]|uniref:DUF2281 domain-containing protein n=1 Tax=Methylobacter sp. TaxID=2051955 RepID=UPI0024895746|nr:DUF2281 domain-containing protein [Methylobacter sp.]MDI1278667.1 DUF2281 domain-containing protein [Methylobacter sp.]MDI1359487.1 DUF2281 domain-containing protein [Methylobacter sp.]
MNQTQLLEKIQALPPDKQAEVFDFVDFLASRSASNSQHDEWIDAEFSEMAMSQALRGMEDEPPLYTQADLKERWR